jgi:hypothetical protein
MFRQPIKAITILSAADAFIPEVPASRGEDVSPARPEVAINFEVVFKKSRRVDDIIFYLNFINIVFLSVCSGKNICLNEKSQFIKTGFFISAENLLIWNIA